MTLDTPSITIVKDHPDWLVIYKPAGLSFHSESGDPGVIECLREQLNTRDIWPVHRLDKPTSGLLLVAKTQQAAAELSAKFEQRQVQKYYLALTSTKPRKKQGWIKGDMTLARRGAQKLLKTLKNPAITYFESTALTPGLRLSLLKPFTGKTHQLRVALKSLSAPILGDELYGGEQSDRLYLHAFALVFEYGLERWEVLAPPVEGDRWQGLACVLSDRQWDSPFTLSWPTP